MGATFMILQRLGSYLGDFGIRGGSLEGTTYIASCNIYVQFSQTQFAYAQAYTPAIVALFARWYSYWGDRLVWTLQLSFRDKLPMFERMKLAAWT